MAKKLAFTIQNNNELVLDISKVIKFSLENDSHKNVQQFRVCSNNMCNQEFVCNTYIQQDCNNTSPTEISLQNRNGDTINTATQNKENYCELDRKIFTNLSAVDNGDPETIQYSVSQQTGDSIKVDDKTKEVVFKTQKHNFGTADKYSYQFFLMASRKECNSHFGSKEININVNRLSLQNASNADEIYDGSCRKTLYVNKGDTDLITLQFYDPDGVCKDTNEKFKIGFFVGKEWKSDQSFLKIVGKTDEFSPKTDKISIKFKFPFSTVIIFL